MSEVEVNIVGKVAGRSRLAYALDERTREAALLAFDALIMESGGVKSKIASALSIHPVSLTRIIADYKLEAWYEAVLNRARGVVSA